MDLDEECVRILPHRPPMVLLDRILATGPDHSDAEWRVPADGPWVRAGRLRRGVLVEVAAQAAAAGAGMERSRAGLPPVPGVLGGLRSVRFHGDALAGDRVRARVAVRLRFDRLVRVDFAVDRGGEVLCEGEMTLAPGGGAAAPADAPGGGEGA